MSETKEKLLDVLYRADQACCNKDCAFCVHSGNKFFCKIHFYVDHLVVNGAKIPTLCKDCRWWEKYEGRLAGKCRKMRKITVFDDFCSFGTKEDKK